MRRLEWATGLCLVVVLCAALPVALSRSSRESDLRVRVRSTTPYVVAPAAGDRVVDSAVTVEPPRGLGRAERVEVSGAEEPGLWLRAWTAARGQDAERGVAMPVLTGPFDDEAAPWPCAFGLRLSARFFDDGAPGGDDVAASLEHRIEAMFPRMARPTRVVVTAPPAPAQPPRAGAPAAVRTAPRPAGVAPRVATGAPRPAVRPPVAPPAPPPAPRATTAEATPPAAVEAPPEPPPVAQFDAVDRVVARVQLGAGSVRIPVQITLRDRTQFTGTLQATVAEHESAPAPRVTLTDFRWIRPPAAPTTTPATPSVFTAAEDRAAVEALRRELVQRATEVLTRALSRVRPPAALYDDRASDRVQLRHCGAPTIAAEGVTMSLGLAVAFGDARGRPEIPGPVRLDGAAHWGEASASPALGTAEVIVTPEAVNQVLYLLWRSGRLRTWGAERRVADGLVGLLRERLPFAVTRFDTTLPPTLVPDGSTEDGRWRVRLAGLTLGTDAARRTVVAHGDARLAAVQTHGTIALVGAFERARANCVTATPGEWVLTPCYAETPSGGPSRERAGWSPDWTLDDHALNQLVHTALGDGAGVAVSAPAVSRDGTGQLRVVSAVRLTEPTP